MYYGRTGEPISLEDWARLAEDITYRRVAYDEIPATTKYPASYVSTVWLGIDHNFLLKGPPVIFETMRFALEPTEEDKFLPRRKFHAVLTFPDPEGSDDPSEYERYCTEEQASLGHRLIVRLIQEKEMQ